MLSSSSRACCCCAALGRPANRARALQYTQVLSARAAGQLPFALSWWGFTFPIGAFVAESLRLSKVLGWNSTFAIGVAAWLLLCFFWLVTLFRTARGVASGAIFQPHP